MNLGDLEARLRSLIEVKLVGLLAGRDADALIVHKLATAIEDNAITLDSGVRLAPNLYKLTVPPNDLDRWQQPPVPDNLAEVIRTAAREAGLQFDFPPTISFSSDPNLKPDRFEVTASHRTRIAMDDTQNTSSEPDEEGVAENAFPENAFLIIEGVKVFPLTVPVVNIGRRMDNTLVIDDPRVSRNHAQLRAIKGRYVLFDLNSTGGTFINGQRASQSVLYPGDVISLAGVALIFGQDNPPPRPDLAPTSPLDSASTDRPTAVLRTMPPTRKTEK